MDTEEDKEDYPYLSFMDTEEDKENQPRLNFRDTKEVKEDQPHHLLPDIIKHAIVIYKMAGDKSNRKIAKQISLDFQRRIGHQTVKQIWKKYQERGDVSNQWSHEGRPQLLTDEDRELLIAVIKENRMSSSMDLVKTLGLGVSRSTVNRALLIEGYKSYKAPVKPLLSNANQQQRLRFALQHQSWGKKQWGKVIFSDESAFGLIHPNGRIHVRRLPEEKLHPDCIQVSAVKDENITVWGAISEEGVGPLVRAKGTICADDYLDFFRFRLRRYYPGLFDGRLIYQDDNAGIHHAYVVNEWFKKHGVARMVWPAKSPDLNIIENVWGKIKYEIRGRIFTSKDEVWKEVKYQWDQIPLEFIQHLYEGLPRRIQAVLDADGGPTKY